MWNSDAKADGELATQITPVDVLYYYDGPTLFTATLGFTDFLFHKVEETDSSDIFLVAEATAPTVEAVKQGRLSVWGALQHPSYHLLELDKNLVARRYWSLDAKSLPPDFLPRRGYGLATNETQLADSVDQANSFFSIKYTGKELGAQRLPFSLFKGLVNDTYDAVRKIFPAPMIGDKSLQRAFDFEVLEPSFGSLIIAIDEATVDTAALKKDIREKFKDDLVRDSLDVNRRSFFENLNEIIATASVGEIPAHMAIQHFITLDQVNDIVPSGGEGVERVEFRAGRSDEEKPILVDDQLGERIRRAHRIAETSERQITGVVVEVNAESGTFIIKDFHHRQTTCVTSADEIDESRIAINRRVQVKGDFQKRQRRDKLQVRSLRVLE
ncbi:hypothetical protein AUC71_12565 [Methyloceanibacter marginalis]|uniref:Uncharacterized protein n=1 Tax=Methyloceanibacter marginalis TaxID=1774971 RepID=A0A1E3WAW1_9HYPH|nr:hypothetical protein [Methyloceanibacter marginalis]ODS02931.1 hypothetical protein AUC71_12565 [Methyloceanibacter marginalis]